MKCTNAVQHVTASSSRAAVFKLFWLRTPILLRHSWRTPTLVTVKFTAKYSNSWAHCFLQTNQHHKLYTNYNGRQAMLVWWMCLLRFAQTVNWKRVGRKLLKTVQTMTTFRNPVADPLVTRRGPPLVRGPQFENRWVKLSQWSGFKTMFCTWPSAENCCAPLAVRDMASIRRLQVAVVATPIQSLGSKFCGVAKSVRECGGMS